ncbi:probable fatty acid-binding protein [Anastrepha obliqua]|uniref:probable fatty acid-binding protein n=1 Tax=Anastrepha obliqua TaxID=95512 RepID=UPI00240A2A9D|nr:probable fatty acid-binding protein [Anastrepha obliqua]
MAVWEGKKYKLEKSENFDEYMKELGNSVSPTVELKKDGDNYSFTTTSTFKTTTVNFKLGEEFDEEFTRLYKCAVRYMRSSKQQ